jgi:hypothetical protein
MAFAPGHGLTLYFDFLIASDEAVIATARKKR